MRSLVFSRHPEFVVILAGVAVAMHVGKLSPAIPVLREALGVSLVQAGFLLSLVQLAGMLLGLVVGLAADGIGLRRAMLTGLLLLSFASGLGAFAQDPETLLLLRAVEGCGFLLAVMPAPGLIRRHTPASQMPSAMGLWSAYMPFGTALALGSGPVLIGWAGWRVWWLALACLTLLTVLWVFLAIAKDPPPAPTRPDPAATARQPRAARPPLWLGRLRNTLTARGPWLVAVCFALYAGQWLAVIGFLPSMADQAGAAGPGVGLLLALVALVNVVGNVAAGRLLQRGVSARHLLFGGFCAMALGAVVAFAASGWGTLLPRYLGILLFSMVGGVIPGTLFSLAVMLAPDEASISTTVGWMQQLSSFGQFVGPPVVAWVAARAGGWQWTWMVTGSSCLLGLLVAQRIGLGLRRQHV